MSEKPKRPWFRFHLLTLVLMALVAGGMLGANILLHPAWPVNRNESQRRCMRGFPCAAYSFIDDTLPEDNYGGGSGGGVSGYFEYQPHFRFSGVAADSVLMLIVVIGVLASSELLIRHREARKT
jgi:hypothetical protein